MSAAREAASSMRDMRRSRKACPGFSAIISIDAFFSVMIPAAVTYSQYRNPSAPSFHNEAPQNHAH